MGSQGIKNCIKDLENQQEKINTITTDRHPQIKTNITEEKKDIN